jgi:prevent-host-death family protein
MKRASVTEAKNRLSALIDYVRQGDKVIIEDRGVPVARLESVTWPESGERVTHLVRRGLVRPPLARLPADFFDGPLPKPSTGAWLSEAILAEREGGA